MPTKIKPPAATNEKGLALAPEIFIELEHVSVARGMKTVLHDISLRVRSNEHLVILGPNGCGKSTLIKTLTCECYPLARPETRVRIFGRDRWELSELRRRLGIVEADLPRERTLHTIGRDAVLSGFFASATIWPGMEVTPEMAERADAVIERLDAQRLAEKPVGEMSAGEMRRILIGRALVHNPKVLLIDEPSNALDLAAQHELRQTLRKLARHGTGILLVTHHLADIPPEIERVVMLSQGKIVADGPKRRLLTKARLQKLFGVPLHFARREGYYHVW